ncbi:hypothetical protein CCP3SC15_550002 [Gammaproteobacteria bacterium]
MDSYGIQDSRAGYSEWGAGRAISLDEMCSLLVSDQTKGSQAASLIATSTGTYNAFRNLGYSTALSISLAGLGLMQSSAEQMLHQQFGMVQTILQSNSGAATAFMAWASPNASQGQIGLGPNDILAAANTEAEKKRIVDWMVTQGYLQTS